MSNYNKECNYADKLYKEMLKCPFCGSTAEILHYENDGYLPKCSECDGMIEKWFDTPEQAVEAWNRQCCE